MKGKIVKSLIALCLVATMVMSSFAAVVSDDDSSAFVTKAEFEAIKNNYDNQIKGYLASVDEKIDNTIANYLNNFAGGAGTKFKYRHVFSIAVSAMNNPLGYTGEELAAGSKSYIGGGDALTGSLFIYIDDDNPNMLNYGEFLYGLMKTFNLRHYSYYSSGKLYSYWTPTNSDYYNLQHPNISGYINYYTGTGASYADANSGAASSYYWQPAIYDIDSEIETYKNKGIFGIFYWGGIVTMKNGVAITPAQYSLNIHSGLCNYDMNTKRWYYKYVYNGQGDSAAGLSQMAPLRLDDKKIATNAGAYTYFQRQNPATGTTGSSQYLGSGGEWGGTLTYWSTDGKYCILSSGDTLYTNNNVYSYFGGWCGFDTSKSKIWNIRKAQRYAIEKWLDTNPVTKGKVTIDDITTNGKAWKDPDAT